MVLRAYPRQKGNLFEPFVGERHFEHLTVDDFEMSALPDAAWNEYERNGDAVALATKHAQFFRFVFMPSLASALDRVRKGDVEVLRSFGNSLEDGLKRRLTKRACGNALLRAGHCPREEFLGTSHHLSNLCRVYLGRKSLCWLG
jgi:hypothetical protein